MTQLIQFCQNGTGHHVLDLNFTSPLRIQEKEKFAHSCYHVERIEGLCQVLKLGKSGHQFKNVVLQVFFLQVTVAVAVVKTDLDSGLEKVHLPNYIVKEGDDFDPTEFVSFKFKEGARSEELAALSWQQRGNVHKLVIVNALVLVIWLREMVF